MIYNVHVYELLRQINIWAFWLIFKHHQISLDRG